MSRPGRISTVIVGIAVSLTAWLTLAPWDIHNWMIGAPFGRDFVNFWMAPRLMLSGDGAVLVDLPAYSAAIQAAFGLGHDPGLLFVYPPHMVLFLAPLAALPFLAALLVWTGLNVAALGWTARLCGVGADRATILAVCTSPAAAAMAIWGHFGGFIALGATVAVVESERRPALAGLCLAGLSVKPQFACALGLILLSAGRWRWLVYAAPATAALIAVSAAAFGVEAWQRFLAVTMPLQSTFIAGFHQGMIHTSVTAYFAARFWGLAAGPAWAIQAIAAALALCAAAAILRIGRTDASALMVVLLAALVMQPYAAHYDLAIVAPAMTAVVLAGDRGPSPLVWLAWLLVPLARLLYVLDLPILSVIVPAALFTQAGRMIVPLRSRGDSPAPALAASG